MRREEGQRKHLGLAILIECSVHNGIMLKIYLFWIFSYEMKKSLSSHVKNICSQILNCERDREGEERKFIFDVILILYASLSNYYKANYLLQLLD